MLKILLIEADDNHWHSGSSFASVNTYPVNYKPKSTPVLKGMVFTKQNSQLQLTTGDVTLINFRNWQMLLHFQIIFLATFQKLQLIGWLRKLKS